MNSLQQKKRINCKINSYIWKYKTLKMIFEDKVGNKWENTSKTWMDKWRMRAISERQDLTCTDSDIHEKQIPRRIEVM